MKTSNAWVIVLAAGEGTRISALTTDGDGATTPKQYWAPEGERPMLHWTLERAGRIAPPDRILTVVAEQHERWWGPLLRGLPSRSVIMQPANRGTAAGILLPLLNLILRDRDATVAILPADHYVADEAALERSIRRALELARERREVHLLGMTPNAPEPDYGWVLCGDEDSDGARPVISFVEKPGASLARDLHRRGAFWSSFTFATRALSLLPLFEEATPELLDRFLRATWGDGWEGEEIRRLYASLEPLDFSRDVLAGAVRKLRLVQVPACGWLDLGTPSRLGQWLARRKALAPRVAFSESAIPVGAGLAP